MRSGVFVTGISVPSTSGTVTVAPAHLARAGEVVDGDLGSPELLDLAVLAQVPHPRRLLDQAVAVGVLVDLHLEHVVVELHRQPVVTEAVAVLRAAHLDARVLGLADRAHAPRAVARALPPVGGRRRTCDRRR